MSHILVGVLALIPGAALDLVRAGGSHKTLGPQRLVSEEDQLILALGAALGGRGGGGEVQRAVQLFGLLNIPP